jgi:multidrug resistance protein MdtO
MMWVAFDQLWGAPASVEMKRAFISNLRLLARLAVEPLSKDMKVAAESGYSLRDTISRNFDGVRAFADAVLFEFGGSRQQNLAWRARIVRWQSQLRAIFIIRIALWKYRAQLPGFELPEAILSAQKAFDDQSAKLLNRIADRMEGKPLKQGELEASFEHQEQVRRSWGAGEREVLAPQLEAFLILSRRIHSLETWLNQEI